MSNSVDVGRGGAYLALSVEAASALALFQKEEGSTLFLSHLCSDGEANWGELKVQ